MSIPIRLTRREMDLVLSAIDLSESSEVLTPAEHHQLARIAARLTKVRDMPRGTR